MTRFNIFLEDGVDLVLQALGNATGGEIYVPKIPSYRIEDVAEAVAPSIEHRYVGIRPGEKIHEEMITTSDSINTLSYDRHYVILPSYSDINVDSYADKNGGTKVKPGFKYHSGENTDWLGADEIRSMIVKHIDPEFSP